MLFRIGSVVLVVLFAGYYVIYAYRQKGNTPHSFRLKAAVTVGAATGGALAVILEPFWRHHVMWSAVAVAVGMGAGFLCGNPGGWKPAIGGALAGTACGVLGTALAAKLTSSNTAVLVTDVIFIFAMVFLQRLFEIEQATKRRTGKGKHAATKPAMGNPALLVAGVAVVGVLLLAPALEANFSPTTPAVQIDEENGLQTATIEVGASGYRPEKIEIKARMMAKINFKLMTDADDMKQLISNDLGIDSTLKPGDNFFLLKNPQPGTYKFSGKGGKIQGTITVK